jgi:hypothetical protein
VDLRHGQAADVLVGDRSERRLHRTLFLGPGLVYLPFVQSRATETVANRSRKGES